MFIAHTELLLQIIDVSWVFFKRWEAFPFSLKCISEMVIEFILNFVVITLRLYSTFERKI